MNKEIIYSIKEYQEKYALALGDFCKNTEFDEIDFITTEIDCYNVYLTSLNVYKRIRYRTVNEPFLDEDTIFLNTNGASYDFIIEALKNKALSESLNRTDGIMSNYKIHFNKIILFLGTKKKELEIQTPQTIIEPEPLDLSKTSAVEKIIYLNELGIIDFLRAKPEFMGSTNLMAAFLSAITDEKAATLQTSLNRLINNDTDDKNHPYKAIGTVNKIKQTFINKNIKHKTS